MSIREQTPAAQIRMAAGLSLEQAARAIGRGPACLRAIELHGRASEHLSSRLAALYAHFGVPCSAEVFLIPPALLSDERRALMLSQIGSGATETPSASGAAGAGSAAQAARVRRYLLSKSMPNRSRRQPKNTSRRSPSAATEFA